MTRALSLLVLSPIALGACTGFGDVCGSDEGCALGLEFRGADVSGGLNAVGSVAVGGIEHVSLFRSDNGAAFTRAYTADSSEAYDYRFPSGTEVVAQDHNTVTVSGVEAGESFLAILVREDGLGADWKPILYDEAVIFSEQVDLVQAHPVFSRYGVPGANEQIVWAPGEQDVAVALWTEPETDYPHPRGHLVDETVVLSMPGASQTSWDTIHIPDAPAGHRTLAVTGGSVDRVVDIETIDTPDFIGADPNNLPLSQSSASQLCFNARQQTRYVAGAEWMFTVDGGDIVVDPDLPSASSGCILVVPHVQGSIHIHATASGYTQTVDVIAP
jgi:hypothetical protein